MQTLGPILFCAVFNRLRGDDRWLWGGSGRALWYVAPAIAFAAAVYTGDAILGALWGAGYALWGVWAWGFLFGLGRHVPDDRDISRLEQMLLEIGCGSVWVAFILRHLFALPAFIAAAIWTGDPLHGFLAFPFAVLVCASYEAAWRIRPDNPIWLAEVMTGALWGAAIAVIR